MQLEQLQKENLALSSIIARQSMELNKIFNVECAITFCDFYEEWLDEHKKYAQPNTYYEYTLNLLLSELKETHFQKYYNCKHAQGISNSFSIRHHINLYSCFKYAVENNHISTNPMIKLK